MAPPKKKPPPSGPARSRPQIRVFRELKRSDAWVTQQARAFAERETQLTIGEFDMIVELGNQTGVRMSDLAKKLVVSPANVTRIAQSLTEKGLVERNRAASSDREVLARLTPPGDALFQAHFPKAVAFMTALMDSQLTEAEQETLGELLAKLGRSPVT